MSSTLRPYVTTGVALVGASLIIATPVAPRPPGAQVRAEVKLLDTETEGFFIGGSGAPISAQSGIDYTIARFDPSSPLFKGQPLFPVTGQFHSLYTPENFYPVTGTLNMAWTTSVEQGVYLENQTIDHQIAEGHNVVIWGGSQSADISALEMRDLLGLPADEQPTTEQLSYILINDEMSPDGGILERYSGLYVPSLGVDFYGAQPAVTPWDTVVYDPEYDGFSDAPQYPIDIFSDINSYYGIITVPGAYGGAPLSEMHDTITLPVSADYTGHTEYFIGPTPELPMLDPLRADGPVGNAIAALLQPDLKVLVNVGYGSITEGWSQGPANVPTPNGLLPPLSVLEQVPEALVKGTQQGIQAFTSDLKQLPGALAQDIQAFTSDLSHLSTQTAAASPISFADFGDKLAAFGTNISAGFSNLYEMIQPAVDTINALTIAAPSWEFSVFTAELAHGHLLDAIGLPIVDEWGLIPAALAGEYYNVEGQLGGAEGAFHAAFQQLDGALQGLLASF